MSTVIADMSISIDGFVADAADGVGCLCGWHGGDAGLAGVGAVLTGRRTFDLAGGWRGRHPLGAPVFVVTHSVPYGWPRDDAPIAFVTDGLTSALERARVEAGDRLVVVGSPSIARQLLDAGRLDRVRLSLVPILLGDGVRPFDGLRGAPIELDAPGGRITHLTYAVRKEHQ